MWFIIVLICIICSVIYFCLYLYKFRNAWCIGISWWCKQICQRFRDDCFERVRADLGRGGRMVSIKDYEKIPELECPNYCLRYTEERWYFIDQIEQDNYFKKNVDECEKELKECRERNKDSVFGCFDYCDKYWKSVVLFN